MGDWQDSAHGQQVAHGLDRQFRIERGTRLPMGGGQEVKETAEKGGPLARLCACCNSNPNAVRNEEMPCSCDPNSDKVMPNDN